MTFTRSPFAIFFMRLGVSIFQILFGVKVFSFFKRLFQHPRLPVATYKSITDLLAFTGRFVWTFDGDIGISDPGYLQWIGQDGNEHPGDCDEFAAYTSTAIAKSMHYGLMTQEGISKIYLAELGWVNDDGSVEGHAICVMDMEDGSWSWMDYGQPRNGFNDLWKLSKDVLSIYASPNRKGLTMALLDVNLNFKRILWVD